MMYSGDETNGDDITSGTFDLEEEERMCEECDDANCDGECADREPEPGEDDWILDDDGKVHANNWHKAVGYIDMEGNINAQLTAMQEREKYYPNVFTISDHGNSCLLHIWEG